MLRLNSIVRKAAFVWNKFSRYHHHCTFLKLCLDRNVIPVFFNFRFHLALNIDNVNLNTFCKHSLQRTSRDICNAVLRASHEKANLLQQELRLYREQLFSKSENAILLRTLKEREKRKWLKTIPLDPGLDSPSATDNPPTSRRSRRYNKCARIFRKRQHFRQRRRLPAKPRQYGATTSARPCQPFEHGHWCRSSQIAQEKTFLLSHTKRHQLAERI